MILVTGGSGFIGSNFIIEWLKNEEELIVNYDKLTYAGNIENLRPIEHDVRYQFIRGDINDSDNFLSVLLDKKPRVVINFAAESHVDRSIHGPEDFIQTNVVGTFRILECVRSYFKGLTKDEQAYFRLIHISTDEVYGSLDAEAPAFTEENAFAPNSPYSASKAASDHIVRAYNHTYNLPFLITNCSNNYGPYQFPEKLIPLIIHNALAGKPLPIYGDGQQIRDWLYVQDHCSAIRHVMERGNIGETYNIGGSNEKPNIEVVQVLCGILDELNPKSDGLSYSRQIKYVEDRPGHDRRYAVNSTKIENELHWKAQETFESGIRKTVKWYLDNQDWVQNVTSGAYKNWVVQQYGESQ